MISKNFESVLEQIRNNELSAGGKRYEALPQLFFLFGISIGFILNLSASIVFELIKGSNVAQVIVLLLTVVMFSLCWYWIHKFYIKPINNLERKIEELKKLIN